MQVKHTLYQKRKRYETELITITLFNLNRFLKLFTFCKDKKISNKNHTKNPTTLYVGLYCHTTLENVKVQIYVNLQR